jgi:hypothetical protein
MTGRNLSVASRVSNQNNYKNLFFYYCPGMVVRAHNRFHKPTGGLSLIITRFLPVPQHHCHTPIQPRISPRFPTTPPGNARKTLRFHGSREVLNYSPVCQDKPIKQPESDPPNMSSFSSGICFSPLKRRSCPGRPMVALY